MRGILINNTVHTGLKSSAINNLKMVMTYKDLPAPTPQTYTVNVPGRNGLLDLTEALTGNIAYNNRTLTFKFVGDGSRETVLNLIETMLRYHGQHITITTDDYPDWYYEGRATVKYSDHGHYVEFELIVDAQPFRYELTLKSTTYTNPSNRVITYTISGQPIRPTITVVGNARIVKDGTTYLLSAGTYTDIGIVLNTGVNNITYTSVGSGTITVAYRRAEI